MAKKQTINLAALVTRAEYALLKGVPRKTVGEAVKAGRIQAIEIGPDKAHVFIDWDTYKDFEFKPDHRRQTN